MEFGRPRVAGAFVFAFRITAGVAFLVLVGTLLRTGTDDPWEDRKLIDVLAALGFGVVLESPEGSLYLLGGLDGVFKRLDLRLAEASDMGGEGGVGVSETVSAVDTDLVSGGVVIIGEEAIDIGEPS